MNMFRPGPTVGAVDSRGRPLPPPRGPACGPRAPGPGAIILSVLLAVAALFLADFVARKSFSLALTSGAAAYAGGGTASITPLFAGATVPPSKGVPLLPPSVRAAAAAASAGAPQPSQAAEGKGGGGGGGGGVSGSFPDGSLSSAGVQQQQSQGSDNGQALSAALSAGGAAVALPVSATAAAGSGGADAPAPAAPAAPGAWRR